MADALPLLEDHPDLFLHARRLQQPEDAPTILADESINVVMHQFPKSRWASSASVIIQRLVREYDWVGDANDIHHYLSFERDGLEGEVVETRMFSDEELKVMNGQYFSFVQSLAQGRTAGPNTPPSDTRPEWAHPDQNRYLQGMWYLEGSQGLVFPDHSHQAIKDIIGQNGPMFCKQHDIPYFSVPENSFVWLKGMYSPFPLYHWAPQRIEREACVMAHRKSPIRL